MADVNDIRPLQPAWPVRRPGEGESRRRPPVPPRPERPPPEEDDDSDEEGHIDEYA